MTDPDFMAAGKCFQENLDLFAGPKEQPKEFNLYAGLLNLARGMDSLKTLLMEVNSRLIAIQNSR